MTQLERKSLVFLMVQLILFAQVLPPNLQAGTGGPAQPEFSTFESVGTNDMVNDFTGTFTWNLPVVEIPGPNGSGYAMSLSYHSGVSPDAPATWVGYGWSLNPGSIVRSVRGFPDDYKNDTIVYYNKTPDNWTVSVGTAVGLEIYSWDLASVGISLNASIRYNNYKGYGYSAGIGHSVAGLLSLNYGISDGEGSFSASISPGKLLFKKDSENESYKLNYTKGNGIAAIDIVGGRHGLVYGQYGMATFGTSPRPLHIANYNGTSLNFQTSLQGNPTQLEIGISGSLSGNYNTQHNTESETENVFGYLYTDESTISDSVKLDYFSERERPFTKHDHFLHTPYSAADNFNLNGEGLSGSFRLHNRKAGHFRPSAQTAQTISYHLGTDVGLGANLDFGLNVGLGFQNMEVGDWFYDGNQGDYQFADENYDEPWFMKFNDDMGSVISFGNDETAQRADLQKENGVPGFKDYSPQIPTSIHQFANNQDERVGRSSYISFLTNAQRWTQSTNPVAGFPNRYGRDPGTLAFVDPTANTEIENGIGELAVFNEAGTRYVYGLPVYSRNEYSLQVGLYEQPVEVDDNYLAFSTDPFWNPKDDAPYHLGEFRATPYASTYLLTEITSPDYVDLDLNGPSNSDLGGWVKFDYTQHAGIMGNKQTSGNWYNWRVPYNGMYYSAGDLTTNEDDLGIIEKGEREVYYLDQVETKTHVAIFYTSQRNDGRDADLDVHAGSLRTSTGAGQLLEKLDSIVVYAKDATGAPGTKLRTTYFEYDYSLMAGVPDNLTTGEGKLTLKKVWFESNGTHNARISPYEFQYEYLLSGDYASEVATRYPEVVNHGDDFSIVEQNPSFDGQNQDAWGAFQNDGINRHQSLQTWNDQNPDSQTFDPAAWQLKRITLPSSGEIQVQYEQNDYNFVQNRRAMAMVSLTEDSDDGTNKFYLNVDDLGLSLSNPDELTDLASLINKEIPDREEKIYFKFLYALVGSNLNITDCNTEYVDGYAKVLRAGVDANGLFVELRQETSDNYDSPQEICWDFVRTQKGGKLNTTGSCDASLTALDNSEGNGEVIMAIANKIGTSFFAKTTSCLDVNWGESYLRIPILTPKKGGGIRVKRLLTYDAGIEAGDAQLYGTEYLYRTTDEDLEREISSGVATWEPTQMRRENPHVNLVQEIEQGKLEVFVAGRDKDDREGPIGEYIMPAPSVGYSKVVKKNIFHGKNDTGFEVKEFHTAKTHHVEYDNTEILEKKDWLILPLGLFNNYVSNLWLTQGYSFILNNMHGQPKQFLTAGGEYTDPTTWAESSKRTFHYRNGGQSLPTFNDFNINSEKLGYETEVIFETRKISDEGWSGSIQTDFSLGLTGTPVVIPQFSAFGYIDHVLHQLSTHVTTKVVRQPAVLERVVTQRDGMEAVQDYTGYNPATGKVTVTKTLDGFDNKNLEQSTGHTGQFTSFSLMGTQQHRELGQKAANEKCEIISDVNNVEIIKYQESGSRWFLEFIGHNGADVCQAMSRIYPGDLLRLHDANLGYDDDYYHAGAVDGNLMRIHPSETHGLFSPPISGVNANIEIVQSGRTNQLATQVGSITTYGVEPAPNFIWHPDGNRDAIVMDLNAALVAGNNLFDINLGAYSGLMISDSNCTETPVGPGFLVVDFTRHRPGTSTTTGWICKHQYGLGGASPYDPYDAQPDCLCPDVYGQKISIPTDSSDYGNSFGHFAIDTATGNVVFYSADNSCNKQIILCLELCPYSTSTRTLDRVIDAASQSLDDDWYIDPDRFEVDVTNYNPYEKGTYGTWRKERQYIYKTRLSGVDGVNANARNYNSGIFDDFEIFQHEEPDVNDSEKWLKMNEINYYSPFSLPEQEQNILNIYNSSKIGYNQTLPYAISLNAQAGHVWFESFENTYTVAGNDFFEDDLPVFTNGSTDNTVAHTGLTSFFLNRIDNHIYLPLNVFYQNPRMDSESPIGDNGLLMRIWVKQEKYGAGIDEFDLADRFKAALQHDSDTTWANFEVLAQTGEWELLQAQLTDFTPFASNDDITPILRFKRPTTSINNIDIWIDDVRLHPTDAAVQCFVYDTEKLNMLASFDDLHFATFFHYDGESKLVRKSVETERGFRTVEETFYHTKTQLR